MWLLTLHHRIKPIWMQKYTHSRILYSCIKQFHWYLWSEALRVLEIALWFDFRSDSNESRERERWKKERKQNYMVSSKPNSLADIEKNTYHYKSIRRLLFSLSLSEIYLSSQDQNNTENEICIGKKVNYRKLMEALKWFPINYLDSFITMRL